MCIESSAYADIVMRIAPPLPFALKFQRRSPMFYSMLSIMPQGIFFKVHIYNTANAAVTSIYFSDA